MQAVVGRLDAQRAQLATLQASVDALTQRLNDEVRPLLQTLVADEAANRRRLYALRAAPDYAAAWSEPDPLVSITVAARGRPGLLAERALPSLLAQTHANLEVIVVGDAAGPSVGRAAASLGDPRVRFSDLPHRLESHADPHRHWLVGSTMARNEAARLARGRWLLHFDDDDALRPDTVERLLARARETGAEVAYGGFEAHRPDGTSLLHQRFPPTAGEFGWQGALAHAGLPFERELVAAQLGVPGDMWLLERMLRAGVRFAAVDGPVWDYYPSTLWEA